MLVCSKCKQNNAKNKNKKTPTPSQQKIDSSSNSSASGTSDTAPTIEKLRSSIGPVGIWSHVAPLPQPVCH